MNKRFLCINFDKSTISAYAAIAGNHPLRVMTIGEPSFDLREMEFDLIQLEQYRRSPTTFVGNKELPPPTEPNVA